MSEPLKLTAADIEEAMEQARAQPPAPVVLTIRAEDVPATATASQRRSHQIRITENDLRPVPPQTEAAPELAELETLMFGLVNSARQTHLPSWLGNASLRWHPGLAAVARGHAVDMLRRGYVDHNSPEGTSVARRVERYGIRYLACGENIGVVYGVASHSQQGIYEIHNAFMNQPRRLTNHRGNLLNPVWTHVGIGVAYDEAGTLVATQNFIATLSGS